MKATWLAINGIFVLVLGARADIITQEQSYSGLTDWSQNLTFNQFNPAWGALNSVTINLDGNVTLTSSIQNNAAGTAYFNITEDFTLQGTVPGSSPLTLSPVLNQSYNIPSGSTVGQTTMGSASQGATLTSGLSAWEGPGTVVLPGSADASFSYSISGGNNVVNLTSVAGLDATVTYDYTAVPDSPVPFWAGGGGLAMVFWMAVRQRKAQITDAA